MTKLDFLPNESIILKTDSVRHGSGFISGYTDDLILTNLSIILVSKGTFGNVKTIQRFPINQIKMYNGKPQAMMGKENGSPALEIYFVNGQESFSFSPSNKKEIQKWIREITILMCGSDDGIIEAEDDTPGEDTLIGAFMTVGKEVSDALGLDLLKQKIPRRGTSEREGNQKVTKKCIACSAPLIGVKGRNIQCKYCDTNQVI